MSSTCRYTPLPTEVLNESEATASASLRMSEDLLHDDSQPADRIEMSKTSIETTSEVTQAVPLEPGSIDWRATTWLTTFFLLMTDVLGPSGAPWSVSKFGYVPGSILFIFMGAFAAYSSILLWHMFLRLDSVEHPIRTWRDIGDRLCGPWFGHLITAMQSMQMFLGVAIVLLGNAQSLSQIIRFKLCFVVISLLLTVLGAAIGCIRTFRRLGIFATFSVFGIIAVCIVTMVSTSNRYPYFGDGSPVRAFAVVRGIDFQTQLVAAMNMVNAYGGSVLFVELMAEMRNPRDFWKSFLMAWSIIVAVYMTFGLYVYSQQGQFTYIPAVQGIGSYVPRTVGNSINIVVHVVAAAMYGNVCLKSLYYPIVVDGLHGPPLATPRGHLIWSFMAVGLWIGAFLIASAIPNFGDLVGVVASLFVIQYTYTLPVFFVVAESKYRLQMTWAQATYKQWFNVIFIVAALVATVLGTYSSIRSMAIDVQEGTTPTAFSCRSPAQPR